MLWAWRQAADRVRRESFNEPPIHIKAHPTEWHRSPRLPCGEGGATHRPGVGTTMSSCYPGVPHRHACQNKTAPRGCCRGSRPTGPTGPFGTRSVAPFRDDSPSSRAGPRHVPPPCLASSPSPVPWLCPLRSSSAQTRPCPAPRCQPARLVPPRPPSRAVPLKPPPRPLPSGSRPGEGPVDAP